MVASTTPTRKVVIARGSEYYRTREKIATSASLSRKFAQFIDTKRKAPHAPIEGGNDTPFTSSGLYGALKLWHYHINADLSVVYRVEDVSPTRTHIYIYGIYSHNDLGTGNPAKRQTQKNMVAGFGHTSFDVKESTTNYSRIEMLRRIAGI